MKQQEKLVSIFYLKINIDKCFIYFNKFYIYIYIHTYVNQSLKLLFFIEF